MLRTLHLRGYRSLLDFRLELGRVTVVTGGNGVGKSNLYRALAMLQRMAEGNFAAAIAAEGGMPSVAWAGPRKKDKPIRVEWEVEHDFFHYSMACGLIPAAPGTTAFHTDPDIKVESLRLQRHGKGQEVARRKGPMVELRAGEGGFERSPLPLHAPESMLAEVRDGIRYPGLAAAREIFLTWRFYHQFRTDADSPLRRPLIGSWSPVLSHDGANLAATLQTILESKCDEPLEAAIAEAFPGLHWTPGEGSGRFQLRIQKPGLKRWMDASELSDGTLRFFCVCAALLTPKPPPLIVLNEPENSLHAGLMPALAGLIAAVPPQTQLIVVTHSEALAREIGERADSRKIDLINQEGETRLAEHAGPRRVWTFSGGDDD
ncbi:AAA family ATPase [Luteolibacter ambystomatis]|uniref:AAA family ATPase n=1 Tax=Luteolibacter ambystomatis TaxID=2824561 RepID=A0A975G711_9BACT|nr:AAA family ATPase [Luteolibacter ambystomatis]QUE50509.1 AAA family ATPase [Luteolibacter ambystomatis]